MNQGGAFTLVPAFPTKFGLLDLQSYGLENGQGVESAACYGHTIVEDEKVELKFSYVEGSLELYDLTTLTDIDGSGSADYSKEFTTVVPPLPLDPTKTIHRASKRKQWFPTLL